MNANLFGIGTVLQHMLFAFASAQPAHFTADKTLKRKTLLSNL
jgi:hypothetical protein